MSLRTFSMLSVTLSLVVPGCGATEPPTVGEVPDRMVSLAGDFQRLDPGSTTPIDLLVQVVDAADLPVPGVVVEWVTEGDDVVRPYNRLTDIGGKVSARLTLSRVYGVRRVRARVAADTAVAASFTIFGGVSANPPGQPDAIVAIYDNYFDPTTTFVTEGATVRFLWTGTQDSHIVIFDGASPSGAAAAEAYKRSGSADVTFTAPGTYNYYCDGRANIEHGTHTGRVVVQ